MDEKRSVGLSIFGWLEIIIGFIGTFVLAWAILGLIYCLKHPAETEIGGAMALMAIFIFLPSPFLFLGGIGVIRLKNWARKINLILLIIILILLTIALLYHIVTLVILMLRHPGLSAIGQRFTMLLIIDIIVGLFLTLPLIWFLKNFKPKSQK